MNFFRSPVLNIMETERKREGLREPIFIRRKTFIKETRFSSLAETKSLSFLVAACFTSRLIDAYSIQTKKMASFCKHFCGPKKPLPPPQEQVDTTIHLKKSVVAKETPYGFINIFPGKNYCLVVLSANA